MKRIKKQEPLGLASEMIIEQIRRTKFWFWAFIVAITAFFISCIRATMQN